MKLNKSLAAGVLAGTITMGGVMMGLHDSWSATPRAPRPHRHAARSARCR